MLGNLYQDEEQVNTPLSSHPSWFNQSKLNEKLKDPLSPTWVFQQQLETFRSENENDLMWNELNVLNYRNILSNELWPTYTNTDKFNQGVKRFKEQVH